MKYKLHFILLLPLTVTTFHKWCKQSRKVEYHFHYWVFIKKKNKFYFYQSTRILFIFPSNTIVKVPFPLWTVNSFTKYEVLVKTSLYTCTITVFFFIHITWSNLKNRNRYTIRQYHQIRHKSLEHFTHTNKILFLKLFNDTILTTHVIRVILYIPNTATDVLTLDINEIW